jgi:putative membrane protein
MKPLFVCVALALPCAASAADSTADSSFYKKAAEGGIAEVELGKLAREKSSNPRVKEFGRMMVSDHTAANEKLKTIAASKDVKLPASPSMGQMATKMKLQALTGDAFDKSYIKGMIKDHEEDIKEFQNEATSGQDPDAKAYAKATLPTLQVHLEKIRQIAASENVEAD